MSHISQGGRELRLFLRSIIDWTRRYLGRFLAPDSSNRQSFRHEGHWRDETDGGAPGNWQAGKLTGRPGGSATTPESASLDKLTLSSWSLAVALDVDDAEEPGPENRVWVYFCTKCHGDLVLTLC